MNYWYGVHSFVIFFWNLFLKGYKYKIFIFQNFTTHHWHFFAKILSQWKCKAFHYSRFMWNQEINKGHFYLNYNCCSCIFCFLTSLRFYSPIDCWRKEARPLQICLCVFNKFTMIFFHFGLCHIHPLSLFFYNKRIIYIL